MTTVLLIAMALPIACLLITTVLLASRHDRLPRVLQGLTAWDAVRWSTMVGIGITVAALRWGSKPLGGFDSKLK